MTTTHDDHDDTDDVCERCGGGIDRYHYPLRTVAFCWICDAEALHTFSQQAEMRDFCQGCGHLHTARARRCDDPDCPCDAHMTMTRRTVKEMLDAGVSATIVQRDGYAQAADVACARCACPIHAHTPSCERCSCDGVVYSPLYSGGGPVPIINLTVIPDPE